MDDAFDLPVGADLIVTVAVDEGQDEEFRRNWSVLGKWSLGRIYGDDEPEYTLGNVPPVQVALP